MKRTGMTGIAAPAVPVLFCLKNFTDTFLNGDILTNEISFSDAINPVCPDVPLIAFRDFFKTFFRIKPL